MGKINFVENNIFCSIHLCQPGLKDENSNNNNNIAKFQIAIIDECEDGEV